VPRQSLPVPVEFSFRDFPSNWIPRRSGFGKPPAIIIISYSDSESIFVQLPVVLLPQECDYNPIRNLSQRASQPVVRIARMTIPRKRYRYLFLGFSWNSNRLSYISDSGGVQYSHKSHPSVFDFDRAASACYNLLLPLHHLTFPNLLLFLPTLYIS
jgi:hypothetical protein